MVIVTASEARSPRKDLPIAARYMYLIPLSFYLAGIVLVGLCTDYRNEALYHPHKSSVLHSTHQSPFIIVIEQAGITALPGFLNACFLFSALTAASVPTQNPLVESGLNLNSNSALYASSRTLFFMARNSGIELIKNTIGRTNRGQTPLTAILFSFIPGAVAFIVVKYESHAFKEVGFGEACGELPLIRLNLAIACSWPHIYWSCFVYICFRMFGFPQISKGVRRLSLLVLRLTENSMKSWSQFIERDSEAYRQRHYRAHWQPIWAIIGLVLCLLLVIFGGWNAVFELCSGSHQVPARDSIVDLIFIYMGVSCLIPSKDANPKVI